MPGVGVRRDVEKEIFILCLSILFNSDRCVGICADGAEVRRTLPPGSPRGCLGHKLQISKWTLVECVWFYAILSRA